MLFELKPIDEALRKEGFSVIAGVDEAGRGPLAGPVFAAAVILPADNPLPRVLDSKSLTPAGRDKYYRTILDTALSWNVSSVGSDVIDEINILRATLRAMAAAVRDLPDMPDFILVDGIHAPSFPAPVRTLKRGDGISQSIGAASVLAKVERDRAMEDYHAVYPEYGFDRHKGYGTRDHKEAIARHGPCPIHRRTFRGVREHL